MTLPIFVTLSVGEGSCHSEPKAKCLASLRMTKMGSVTNAGGVCDYDGIPRI